MKRSRGVVLLHTLIMLMVLAYISVLLLQWTLARAVAAKTALDSNENTALLAALQSKISTCLSPNSVAGPPDCNGNLDSLISGCMNDGSLISYRDINGLAQTRRYTARLCPTACATLPCSCMIQVKLCVKPSDCNTPPACSTPVLWTK